MSEQAVSLYAVRSRVETGERIAASRPGSILGKSSSVERLRHVIDQVAQSDANVFIAGESGSGKELVAREIHARSGRASQPFVAVNCAALPVGLMESELFGHVRGAFTDAKRSHEGLFVQADHGTVFLDEIGEMPLEVQAKLLRVVEERRVRPIGSESEVPVRARLLTATNRDLESEVEANRFRADLYYRINAVEVSVPSLRERGDDVLLLARHFLRRYATEAGKSVSDLAPEAVRCLLDYAWPGNVRELQNCVLRGVTLAAGRTIARDDLPPRIQDTRSASVEVSSESPADLVSLLELQRRYIRRVLAAVGGNKTRAARVLGVDRRTFYRLCERLGLSIAGRALSASSSSPS